MNESDLVHENAIKLDLCIGAGEICTKSDEILEKTCIFFKCYEEARTTRSLCSTKLSNKQIQELKTNKVVC